jgi:16S rRNA processing protein RimM
LTEHGEGGPTEPGAPRPAGGGPTEPGAPRPAGGGPTEPGAPRPVGGGPSGWLLAGRVGRPHGLDGSFHVLEGRAPLLESGRTVRVGRDGPEVEIVRRAGTDDRPIVRLDGWDDREGAESLRGRELLAALDEAPALEEDEFWAEQLEGCRVVDAARGVEVGVVARLMALPSCEVLEVRRPSDGDPLLVPLVRDAVRSVDIDGKLVDVDTTFLGEDVD